MNSIDVLAHSPLVTLARFQHPQDAGDHRDPEIETSHEYSVNFIERGEFRLRSAKTDHRMAVGAIFVTTPGMAYVCEHEEAKPTDVCLSISFPTDAIEPLHESTPGLMRSAPLALMTNRLAYLKARLCSGVVDPLSLEVVSGAVLCALGDSKSSGRLFPPGRLRWYIERVEAAREFMETSYAQPLCLGDLGRHVGMSPFHFARVFTELAGTPPHRYLMKVRLERAASLLAGGASVTGACFAAGFNNLSHFIRLFTRTHGCTPSRFSN